MCQKESQCEWFNWSKYAITKCWLKMGKGIAKYMPGVTTGPKYCEPERKCIERGKMYIGDGFGFRRQKSEAACQVFWLFGDLIMI